MDKEEDMEESLAAQWIERYFCDRMWTPEIKVYAGVVRLSLGSACVDFMVSFGTRGVLLENIAPNPSISLNYGSFQLACMWPVSQSCGE
jgi:hypothetical protein